MRTSLNTKLTKAVRNYNAKISRLQKINPSLALPDKVSVKGVKASGNKKEILRTLESLKRFSKRGAEETIILPSGELISKYELGELKRESARLKRNLTKRINELASIKPKVKGVEGDYTYAEMGDMRLNNMIAKRNALKMYDKNVGKTYSIKEYTKFLEKTKNKQNYQIDIFRNNYMDKMLLAQAYAIGYDQERITKIKEEMNKLSDKDFLKFFDREKIVQAIRDKYPDFSKLTGQRYFDYEREMTEIFDELYENIGSFLTDYPSYNA